MAISLGTRLGRAVHCESPHLLLVLKLSAGITIPVLLARGPRLSVILLGERDSAPNAAPPAEARAPEGTRAANRRLSATSSR